MWVPSATQNLKISVGGVPQIPQAHTACFSPGGSNAHARSLGPPCKLESFQVLAPGTAKPPGATAPGGPCRSSGALRLPAHAASHNTARHLDWRCVRCPCVVDRAGIDIEVIEAGAPCPKMSIDPSEPCLEGDGLGNGAHERSAPGDALPAGHQPMLPSAIRGWPAAGPAAFAASASRAFCSALFTAAGFKSLRGTYTCPRSTIPEPSASTIGW